MLSEIFSIFLSPSFFIIIFFLLGLFLLLKKKYERKGKILFILGIIFYYSFSITPVANLILKPLENRYDTITQNDFSLASKIVVLSGNSETNILRISEAFKIYFGRLQKEEKSKIIFSGKDVFLGIRDETVKNYLSARGVLLEDIILEDKSRNTFENAKNIKELIDDELFFLVTSGYHMSRSVEVFQKMGANPIPVPTDFKIKTEEYNVLDFLPDAQNLRKSDFALHEYFGILFYRLWY